MNWSAFFGAWLGTWCWIAVGLILWRCGDALLRWVHDPWRKADRMRRGKNFTQEQWDAFMAEVQRVASHQWQQVRTTELNEENAAKVDVLLERMRLAEERATEVLHSVVLPRDARDVLEKVVLLLDPSVGINGINLDVHVAEPKAKGAGA